MNNVKEIYERQKNESAFSNFLGWARILILGVSHGLFLESYNFNIKRNPKAFGLIDDTVLSKYSKKEASNSLNNPRYLTHCENKLFQSGIISPRNYASFRTGLNTGMAR